MPPSEVKSPSAAPGPDAGPWQDTPEVLCLSACPVCGGLLLEVRAKLHCIRCHTLCETCCDGGRM
jgi:hypothetical protein